MHFSVFLMLLSELLEQVCQGLSLRKPINADANLAEVAVLGSKWFLTLKAKHISTLGCLREVFHSHRCLWLPDCMGCITEPFCHLRKFCSSTVLSTVPQRFSLLHSLGIPLPILYAQAIEIVSCLGLLSMGNFPPTSPHKYLEPSWQMPK